MDFKVGDVVEVDEGHVSNAGFKWAQGKKFTVLETSYPTLYLTPEGTSPGHVNFNPNWYEGRRFKKVEVPVSETLARSEKAMPIEVARQARALMLKAVPAFGQKDVIIRTRSWSYSGEYAAIEIPSEGGGPLYNTAAVLDWLKARQKPVQVLGTKILDNYWTFIIGVTPRGKAHNYVKNPNGNYYWTQGQLEACNGIAEQDGVTYHLGVEKFVRFGS